MGAPPDYSMLNTMVGSYYVATRDALWWPENYESAGSSRISESESTMAASSGMHCYLQI